MKGIYRYRYLVEPWNKPRPKGGTRMGPNVVMSDDDHGYTDALLVASVILGPDNQPESVALFSSEGGQRPTREMLELIRDQINHQLAHHMN